VLKEVEEGGPKLSGTLKIRTLHLYELVVKVISV